jgi:hypothetical protein
VRRADLVAVVGILAAAPVLACAVGAKILEL